MGPNPVGRITYTDEGFMSATMMPSGRTDFEASDVLGGTDSEKLAAAKYFVTYCGPFDVRDDTVYHTPELTFFPNWVGQELPRMAKLEGDKLILTTSEMVRDGKLSTAEIVWQRWKKS
jgi:hypothetical protein